MSPLEKVPFATFYPLQKYLRGTCFFSKTTFSSGLIYWCSRVILCIQFYRLTQLFFLHHLRALSAKNANHLQTTDTLKRHQRYSIRYHCGWPSLVIWGSDTHNGLTALPEPFLRACGLYRVCTGFVQGLYRVCTGFVQGLYRVCTGYQKIKTAEQFTLLPASFATPICIWRSRTNRSKSFILDLGHWRPCRKFCQFHEFGNDEFLGIRQIIVILWKGICFSNGSG